MIVTVVLTLMLLAVIFLAYKTSWRSQFANLPGPNRWPILGNTVQLAVATRERFDRAFTKWFYEYGHMYRLSIFNKEWIVLGKHEDIHEVLVTQTRAFSMRPRQYKMLKSTYDFQDVVFGDPSQPYFFPLKTAAGRALHQHGTESNRVEETLVPMAQELVKSVRKYNGKAFDIYDELYNFMAKVNVIMLVGRQPAGDTDPLATDIKVFERVLRDALSPFSGVELDMFPWLRYFGHAGWKKNMEMRRMSDDLWTKMCAEIQRVYAPDNDSTCIVHLLAQVLDKNSKFYEPAITLDSAKGLLSNAVGGSMSSTSNTAYALLNLLVHYPNVKQRLHDEIMSVIGDRLPSIFDRDNMPYTNATLIELMRYTCIVPVNGRVSVKETTVGGQKIPANTQVNLLFSVMHHDKAYWGDPDVFRPERFLEADGTLVSINHPYRKRLMPFGAGSRVCIGETFALRRLFVIVTSLVQAFDIQPGDTLVSCKWEDYESAFTLHQRGYTLKMVPRY